MATVNQLSGGSFQDILGNPLTNGYLLMQLSADALVNGAVAIGSGNQIRIQLDSNGNVQASPAQSVWPNDAMTAINESGDDDTELYYNVSAYSATGQLVWGPNAQQVFSTPSPYNIGAWTPGIVAVT